LALLLVDELVFDFASLAEDVFLDLDLLSLLDFFLVRSTSGSSVLQLVKLSVSQEEYMCVLNAVMSVRLARAFVFELLFGVMAILFNSEVVPMADMLARRPCDEVAFLCLLGVDS
jgi:hypothetical protein